jgi:hypothetical protein
MMPHSETGGPVIGSGYAPEDKQRITDTLANLLPYLESDLFCISGGIATAAHLDLANNLPHPRILNDMDIVVPSADAIKSAGISSAFKIVEVELSDPVDELFIKLIDKQTGLKVDIFGDMRFPPEPIAARFNDRTVPIRSAPNIGALLLCAIDRRIRHELDIIPKQLIDLFAILEITTMGEVDRNWRRFPKRTIEGTQERRTSGRALLHVEELIQTTSDPSLAQLRKPKSL